LLRLLRIRQVAARVSPSLQPVTFDLRLLPPYPQNTIETLIFSQALFLIQKSVPFLSDNTIL